MAEKNDSTYELATITLSEEPAIKTPEGEILNAVEAMVLILNKLNKIEIAVGG